MRMRIHQSKFTPGLFLGMAVLVFLCAGVPFSAGQDRVISLGVKWLCVSDLQSTFAIEGAEFEMHRTGNLPEQCDGLRWPAQYQYQDCNAAKSMRIGTTNFYDPAVKTTFAYKVVSVGPASVYPKTEIMPVQFKLIGRFAVPEVLVDDVDATNMKLNDIVDEYDPNQLPDRMVYHVLNTTIGVTVDPEADGVHPAEPRQLLHLRIHIEKHGFHRHQGGQTGSRPHANGRGSALPAQVCDCKRSFQAWMGAGGQHQLGIEHGQ